MKWIRNSQPRPWSLRS